MSDQFGKIQTTKIPMTPFDLSYGRRMSAELGLLYPVAFEEAYPRDRWSIAQESVFRASPLFAPILHKIDVIFHSFYAPSRVLMATEDDWINFFTGGEDGDDATSLPTWSPSAAAKRNAGTLWDQLFNIQGVTPDADSLPLDFGRRMYCEVFNEFYRDVAVEPSIDWTQTPGTDQDTDGNALPTGYNGDEDLQYAAWAKDYFTAARPTPQLGDAETLPFTGTIDVGAKATDITMSNQSVTRTVVASGASTTIAASSAWDGAANLRWVDPALEVDVANATQVTIADLRLSLMKQRWKELNMRAGVRYPEYVYAHWGRGIGDARIGRPEYIGGCKQPVVVSDISYQAEGASDPVGTLTGKGTSMNNQFIGKFSVPEHGWIMTLMSIRPKGAYAQGIHRQHTYRTRYDLYDPGFSSLSEQSILQRELYVSGTKSENETVFGYIPAWDHLRVRMDVSNGLLAPGQSFDYWHLTREFASAPTLSASFLRMHDIRDDAWVVSAQPHFFCHVQNILKVTRAMPAISTPGML